MAKKVISELILQGILKELPEEDTIKEDINPPITGCIPCLDWEPITTAGLLNIDCSVENGRYTVITIDPSEPFIEEWINHNVKYPHILKFKLMEVLT